jgi:hypothetical protein
MSFAVKSTSSVFSPRPGKVGDYNLSLVSLDAVDLNLDSKWSISNDNADNLVIKDTSDNVFYSIRTPGGYVHRYGTSGRVGTEFRASFGNLTTPTSLTTGSFIYDAQCLGHNGTDYVLSSTMQAVCAENWSPGSTGSNIEFSITPIGTSTPARYFELTSDALTLGDTNNWTLPMVRGTDGQILVSNGTGNANWSDNTSPLSKAQFICLEPIFTVASTTNETLLFDPLVGEGSMTWTDVPGSAKTYNLGGTISHQSNDVITIRLYYGAGIMFLWHVDFPALTPVDIDYKITIRQVVKDNNFHTFVCSLMLGETTTPSMTYVFTQQLTPGEYQHTMTVQWSSSSSSISQELFTVVNDNSM